MLYFIAFESVFAFEQLAAGYLAESGGIDVFAGEVGLDEGVRGVRLELGYLLKGMRVLAPPLQLDKDIL